MRCLSIRQPWADLILYGHKDIENRTWSTKHRGRLLVHAGMTYDEDGAASLHARYPALVDAARVRTGRVLGAVEVVGCVARSDSPWFFGPVGWPLRNPVPFQECLVE